MPQAADADSRPPAEFISKDVCPFECCTYREWVALRAVPLYERPRGAKTGVISKGDRVQGVTGIVITHPLPYRVAKQEGDIPAGATVYLLHPLGEGFWSVWYRGRALSLEADGSSHSPLRYQWWAKVKTASGRIGWVEMGNPSIPLPFDNVDACG